MGEAWPARGKRILRHDLNERDGQVRHLGSRTGQTAVNSRANAPALTLHLRLTYHQPALFPIIARLASTLTSRDASTHRAWAAGLLVIQLEQKIEMQSDAVQWHAGPVQ